jgi:ketosteroid isomerase-like protein
VKSGIFKSIAICAILITTCQPSIDKEKEKELLLETDREFAATSVRSGAAEAFLQYLDTHALQLPAGQLPIRGAKNIYEQMKPGAEKYTLKWEPQEGNVAASGDLGYTWGIYEIILKNVEGSATIRQGKYLNVWKKQLDGSWKVLIDMGNQNPEAVEGIQK